MSVEHSKAIVRRFLEEGMSGDFAVLDELVSNDFVCHSVKGRPAIRGRATWKTHQAYWHSVLAGLTYKVEDLVADGD